MSLATQSLEVRYGDTLAVAQTSLELAAGELIALVGPNGAGKTSLLRALAGVPSPVQQVSWRGRSLANYGAGERAREIAFLPQAPRANWPLTVRELVALGRLPHRRFGERLSTTDDEAIALAMQQTGVTSLADRSIATLSGGEHMRAHLARAFAVDAAVLLVDEPVASLDPYHQLQVMHLLSDYRDSGRLVVAVLHDLNLALGFCSRLLLMNGGKIAVDGEPASAIDAATLARHYRIRAWLAEHDNRRVAVPWEMIDSND
jgi:iron complex transport system ATP-binding protein